METKQVQTLTNNHEWNPITSFLTSLNLHFFLGFRQGPHHQDGPRRTPSIEVKGLSIWASSQRCFCSFCDSIVNGDTSKQTKNKYPFQVSSNKFRKKEVGSVITLTIHNGSNKCIPSTSGINKLRIWYLLCCSNKESPTNCP